MSEADSVLTAVWRLPWWLRLGVSLPVGVALCLFLVSLGDAPLEVGGAVGVWMLGFVPLVAFVVPEWNGKLADFSALEPDQRRRAHRAAVAGPAPADPAVRAVALQQTERELERLRRPRGLGVAIWLVGIGLYVGLAIAYSPWWLVGVALLGSAPASRRAEQRRLTGRVTMLAADTPMPLDRPI